MENLKITIIQPDIIWENIQGNLDKYSELILKIDKTDVIVLPEMFTTGFSMNRDGLKEKMDGKTVNWMRQVAADKNVSVVGSLIIEEQKMVYNRAVWVFPNGSVQTYDKRHLFTMGNEHLHYTQGNEKTIVEFRGWRFCPLICYDLRFPVWGRNTENYDVLIFMANWPSPRHHHWKLLLQARAIENMSYCIGANRTGADGTGLKYLGDSAVVSHKGIAEFMGENELVRTFELSHPELREYRRNLPFLDDRDRFRIIR